MSLKDIKIYQCSNTSLLQLFNMADPETPTKPGIRTLLIIIITRYRSTRYISAHLPLFLKKKKKKNKMYISYKRRRKRKLTNLYIITLHYYF